MSHAWLSFNGKTYTEREIGGYETDVEARAAALARGGTLYKERMTGAYYLTPDARIFRVSARGWASGFVLWETVEINKGVQS